MGSTEEEEGEEEELEAEVIVPGGMLSSWSAVIPDVCCIHKQKQGTIGVHQIGSLEWKTQGVFASVW